MNIGDVWTVTTSSEEETRSLAASLGEVCDVGDVILLEGPLGAGKTRFVQGLARGLGSSRPVRSPTFVLVARYPGRVPLVHLDLYRIEGETAIDELGLEEQLDEGVLAIEWGEKVIDRWDTALRVVLEESGDEERVLRVSAIGRRAAERLAAWRERAG